MQRIYYSFLLSFLFLSAFGQSDFYWVGGSGNWSNYSSHWATSSGGNIFHTTTPSSNDNVIFDNNSFSANNQTVTLNADNESLGNMTWFGVTNTPTFNMSSKQLMVHGSITYDPMMTINSPGTLTFTSTNTSFLISAGHRIGNIYVDKNGGIFNQLDNFMSDGYTFEVRAGSTYNSNDYDLYFNSIRFKGSPTGSTTTTINTGTSEITVKSGELSIQTESNYPNIIADLASSTIYIDRASLNGGHYSVDNFGHIITRNMPSWREIGYRVDRIRKLEITQGTSYQDEHTKIHSYFGDHHNNSLDGGIIDTLIVSKYTRFENNFNTVIGDIEFKGDALTVIFGSNGTFTVSNSLTFQGGNCSVTTLKSTSAGNQANINLLFTNTVTATNLSIKDMAFTGSGTLVAQASVDNGNNSGVIINELNSRDLYWVGGSGNWSDNNHWSLSDGGSGGQCAPTPNDNVYFTSNSFSAANQTVTLDAANAAFINMDWTSVTNNPTFNMNSKSFEISGSVSYTANMTINSPGTSTFITSSTVSLFSAGHRIGNIYVDKNGGIFNQLDNFMSDGYTFEVRAGSTYNSNDYDLYFNSIRFKGSPTGSTTTTINTGTSEITVKSGELSIQTESNYPNIIADLASSTIYIDRASLNGGHYSVDNFGHIITRNMPSWREIGYRVDRIRKLEITQGTSYQDEHTKIHSYFGDHHNNSLDGGIIDTLIVSKYTRFENNFNTVIGDIEFKGDALTVIFGSNGTFTVSNSLTFQGGNCSVTTLKSTSAGNQANINLLFTNTVTATNLSIKDMAFTGSGTLVAQASVDNGNNSGVTITQLAARDLHWVGGSGNWSDNNHWSLSDGGSGGQCAPTPNDNVYFTSNSFSAANQTVTLDAANAAFINMDWTSVTNNPTFNMNSKSFEISGSVSYTANMTINSPGTSTFITSSTVSLFSAGHRIGNIYVDKNGGIFNQLDNFMSDGYTFEVRAGSTYNSNDYDLYFNSIRFKGSPTGSTTTTINTGTSEITVKSGELSIQTESNYPNIIADLASSTIYIDRASLNGGHYSVDNFGHIITRNMPSWREIGYRVDRIRKLEITQGTSYQDEHTKIHSYFGDHHNNSLDGGIIDTLIVSKYTRFENNFNTVIGDFLVTGDNATIEMGTNGTFTISNSLELGSKSGSRNYMMSTSGGNQASIIYDGPDFCGDYIRLKDISLTTSSTATLGPYSQNEGNVTGFNFNTDTSNTISGMTISVSPTGLSYYENQPISFVLSSTYYNNNSATFHFFVNGQKTQSGTSTTFNGKNLKNGDKVFGSVEIPYSGTVTGCNFTTIGKTDEITLSLDLYPVITSSTYSQTNNTVDVTFNEPVFTENSGSGNLITSDFELSLSGGTAILNSNEPTSVTRSGNTYTLGLNISNLAGSEVLTIKPKYNQIFDKDGRRSDQNQSNNSVRLGTVSASLLSAEVSSDNLTVMVTFSENVFSTVNGSGELEPSDFILEMSGGTATLSSTTPISIFSDNFSYSLGFTFGGIPDGNEVLNVKLADNSVFDIQGVILPSIQTNSSSNLKADSDSDGIANPVDLCPNTANGTSVNMNGCADNASKYFWVGGSGNWSDFSNHWATTSGGNQFHSRAPNGTDNAYFDRYSFTDSGQTLTIDTDLAAVKNMTWTGVTNNPTFNFNGKNLDVFGSVVFAENMTINSANMDFMGTSSATLDTKNKNISSIYLKGSDLTLASPLDIQNFYIKSGSFITNDYDLNTYRFDVDQTSNTSLTIDLGTSTVVNTYELEWDTFRAGNYTTNVSSATIIVKGRTWRDYGSSQWGELRVVELPNQWWSSVEFNANSNVNIKSLIANQTTDQINLNVRNVDEVDISSSANITNLNAKILKLKGNGSIYQFSGTINVSNTLEIGVPGGCAITTFKSTSDGNTATINSADTTVANYLDIKDIIFNGVSSTNIVDNGLVLFLDATDSNSYSGTGDQWTDLSGNGNHGTINGASYSSSGGGSISFDGSNDYVLISDSNSLDLSNEITISYTVAPNWGTWAPFIAKGAQNNYNYSTWIGNDAGIDLDNGSNGSTIKPLYTASNVSNGNWHSITVSIDGNQQVKTYVDGTLKDTRAGSLGSINNLDLQIGRHHGTSYGSGKIGKVLIYNRALSDNEVSQNYLSKLNTNSPTLSGSLTANNSIDNGNNSGFTINSVASRDFYWVGGTGDWSDGNEWSFTSGGNPVGCPPSSGDNVFFDSNSFTSSGQTVKIDIDNAAVNNMNWTGVVSDPTFNFNGKNLDVFGSVAFTESMTLNSPNIDFMGSPLPKESNIIANLPFNGNTLDYSGNANHGTIQNNGASSVTDRYGFQNSAYQFSGVAGGGINIGNAIDLSGSYTISLYAKLDDVAAFTDYKSVFFGHGTQAPNQGLHVILGPDVGIRYGHYNNDYDVGSTNASYYTSWRHYVFVYDGSDHSRKVYIDGQLVSSNDSYNAVDYTGSGNFIIGNHPWENRERFDGVMDDFIIWNDVLSDSEVNSLYNQTNQSTLDSKNKNISSIYLKGSDLTLASPLDIQNFYIRSGSFITNDYDLNTYRFDVDQTSNTSLTIDLGTSTVVNTYELEWDTFRAGNYTTNVSSATIIVKGRTWRDYGSSQWGELRVVELPNQWWSSVEFNANSNVNIKSLIASQTTDQINLNVRNVDEVDISSSANITNLNAKILKLKGNGSIYQFSGTINVSNTLEIGVPGGCAITTFKSTSDGNTATINSDVSAIAVYLDVKDIIFTSSNSATLTANNSIDNGNNSGINFGLLGNRTFYWVGGTGNWSDGSHWSSTSGGVPSGCPPSSGDNVFFDSNSFTSSGQSIKIDIDNAGVNDMTWTGVTNNPTFNFNGKNLDVFGSVVFAENMTINSANMDFMGTSSATLDTKNKNISSIYLKGSDLTLASPLDIQNFYIKSGSFITNDYDLNTYRFDVDQTSNTSLTIDLGTSTVVNTYELEWDTFRAGNYTTNVSSATIIVKGRTWRDYGSSQWGELRVVELPNQWWSSVEFNANSNVNIKSLIANQTTDQINLNVRNVDEVDISSSANITNLNAKILKLKGNGAVYQMGGTINVSNTLDITSNLGVVNSFSSNSNGNQSIINYNNPLCVDYISIKDINFTNTTTVTAGPNSVDNGNNLGVEFFTDNNITIQAFTINSSMGTSIADFEESSFTATSTSGFDQNMIFNWYVDNVLKQSGSSTSFSPGIITENYTVECATEIPYNGGQGNSSCPFVVKAKSNSINMNVSSKPIIKETKITQDNQYIKVRFSKPVFTNSNGTGELTTNDFRLYLNGGDATLSSSYPNSVEKDGDFYKLTFGLNGKFNGEEQITVKPNGNSNIYDNQGQGAEQDNQSNNTVTLNYNPPIIDGVSVNSSLNELTIVFSEPVNGSDQPPYNTPLKYNVFHLSVSGGTASLLSPLPDSISGSLDTYKVRFTLNGTPDGNEIFQVTPVFNSIFDLQGFPASHLQGFNTTCSNCDGDNDGVIDARDLCPNTASGTTVDQNGCSNDQKDADYDGVPDYLDYCLNTPLGTEVNSNGCAETQTNQESPTIEIDNNQSSNTNNTSGQNNNQPDEKDPNDLDGDGYSNSEDAFPNDPREQKDFDGDGIGDNADKDDDNDGFSDNDENRCKTNPKDSTSTPNDNDGDQIVDCIDSDDDNDGVEDSKDAFPLDDSEYIDTDGDGIGNNADLDDDGDGYSDEHEIECETDPLRDYKKPRDYDMDMIPDCIDQDDDNDGCIDEEDLFPLNERECLDSDGDGIPDNLDFDADNDGVEDVFDDFPLNPNESKDTDGDGIGDNEDIDDNNDGFPEEPVINSAGEEVIPIFVSELLTPNQPGVESKWRIVNIDKYPTANVKVYDPSGVIIYESWSYKNDWDGTNKNGKPLPTGPYFYVIDRGDETKVEEGWLYLFN